MLTRVIEDDAHSALRRQLQEHREHIRLVQVVGEDVEMQAGIVYHTIEDVEDLLARRRSHPAVDIGILDALTRSVGAGRCRGIELQRITRRFDGRLAAEVAGEGLRLHVAAGETEREGALLERTNGYGDGGA